MVTEKFILPPFVKSHSVNNLHTRQHQSRVGGFELNMPHKIPLELDMTVISGSPQGNNTAPPPIRRASDNIHSDFETQRQFARALANKTAEVLNGMLPALRMVSGADDTVYCIVGTVDPRNGILLESEPRCVPVHSQIPVRPTFYYLIRAYRSIPK